MSSPLAVTDEGAPGASSSSIDDGVADRGLGRYLSSVRARPVLWMVAAPVALASLAVGVTLALTPARVAKPVRPEATAPAAPRTRPPSEAPSATQRQASVEELEARPAESLSASELLRVADGRAERRRAAARALGEKLERDPALAADKATQAELLRLARDVETAREALGVLAHLKTPLAADLLYDVWTGTPGRSEATELSRALLYSPDVRPHASPALAAALELRAAQTCEAVKRALPQALKDGDRRALAPLSKLAAKRGCGPKKNEDCYACLRAEPDELTATINATKSRRPPAYAAP